MRSETIRRLAAFLSVILAFPCSALPREDKVEVRSSRVGSSPGGSKKPILIGTPFEGEGSRSMVFSSGAVASGVSIGPGEGATTLEKNSNKLSSSSSPYLGEQVAALESAFMEKEPASIVKSASLAEKGVPAERSNPPTLRLSQEKPLPGPSTAPLSEEKRHLGPSKLLIPASSHTFVPRKGTSVPPSTARSWSTGTKSSSSSAAAAGDPRFQAA